MKRDRREFLRFGAVGVSLATVGCLDSGGSEYSQPDFQDEEKWDHSSGDDGDDESAEPPGADEGGNGNPSEADDERDDADDLDDEPEDDPLASFDYPGDASPTSFPVEVLETHAAPAVEALRSDAGVAFARTTGAPDVSVDDAYRFRTLYGDGRTYNRTGRVESSPYREFYAVDGTQYGRSVPSTFQRAETDEDLDWDVDEWAFRGRDEYDTLSGFVTSDHLADGVRTHALEAVEVDEIDGTPVVVYEGTHTDSEAFQLYYSVEGANSSNGDTSRMTLAVDSSGFVHRAVQSLLEGDDVVGQRTLRWEPMEEPLRDPDWVPEVRDEGTHFEPGITDRGVPTVTFRGGPEPPEFVSVGYSISNEGGAVDGASTIFGAVSGEGRYTGDSPLTDLEPGDTFYMVNDGSYSENLELVEEPPDEGLDVDLDGATVWLSMLHPQNSVIYWSSVLTV